MRRLIELMKRFLVQRRVQAHQVHLDDELVDLQQRSLGQRQKALDSRDRMNALMAQAGIQDVDWWRSVRSGS